MSATAKSSAPASFSLGAADAAAALRRELLAWAWLAVGALAIAGVFALLLALSRIPGMDRAPFWPIDFFYKGLVIHVVFSLVIWLLGVFAFLVTAGTLRIGGQGLRAAPLGRIGQGLVLVAFPCLFAPAFFDASLPELTNYVPLIRNSVYDLGLTLLALGILAPVVRLFLNLAGAGRPLAPLTLAMAVGGLIYALALVAFAIAGALLAERGGLGSRELLFWGGGHLLQFVYATALIVNWRILAARSLGEGAVDDGAFRLALLILGALAFVGPFFYAVFAPFSPAQHEAFRLLQFALALPTLVFAAPLLGRMNALRRSGGLPWRDPAFFTLATSFALFALGGAMGFLITGSDTRTPAHYHAVITAVSVSSAGMLLTFGLDELGRAPASARATRTLIALYGGGQFVASIGMFVAGGYGAARKTPTGVGSLDAVAAAGMAVHGIASIFTILGGAAFVVVAILALLRPSDSVPELIHVPGGSGAFRAALLAALVVAGLAAMGVLRALHSDATSDMVELLGREPVRLSPFLDAQGAKVSPEDFRGRVLILNLWAPWCAPCLAEMPSLDRLAARLPEKDFAVVAVTKDAVGDSPSKRLFEKMGLARLRLYLDPKGALESEIGVRGYPTTLILGADGAPLARREGAANWDSDEMIAKLEALKARSRRPE